MQCNAYMCNAMHIICNAMECISLCNVMIWILLTAKGETMTKPDQDLNLVNSDIYTHNVGAPT